VRARRIAERETEIDEIVAVGVDRGDKTLVYFVACHRAAFLRATYFDARRSSTLGKESASSALATFARIEYGACEQ
jgi:hypothetical protein